MSLEEQLRALANVPKPVVGPFWAARVTARATAAPPKRASVSHGEAIYWIALTVLAGPLLLTTWQRVVCLVCVMIAVRFVAALTPATDSIVTRRHGKHP